ncbi:hypothetical protein Y032_0198g1631 [Ancylostoma ceylanicum]|nr:hypothetical protein Y032_0198g1631 [Ancylostoma ceylanicum]
MKTRKKIMDEEERKKLAPAEVEIRIESDSVHLEIPDEQPGTSSPNMKKTLSMSSLRAKLRDQRAKFRKGLYRNDLICNEIERKKNKLTIAHGSHKNLHYNCPL